MGMINILRKLCVPNSRFSHVRRSRLFFNLRDALVSIAPVMLNLQWTADQLNLIPIIRIEA